MNVESHATPLLLNTITRPAWTPLHLHTYRHSALIFCFWIHFRWITFHHNPALFFWNFRLNLSWQKMMKILHLYFHSLSSSVTTPNTEWIFKTACSCMNIIITIWHFWLNKANNWQRAYQKGCAKPFEHCNLLSECDHSQDIGRGRVSNSLIRDLDTKSKHYGFKVLVQVGMKTVMSLVKM